MIGLGLRLAVSGGREAVVRLVIVAVAVGLGVGLLLTALSATSAVKVQNARHAWLWTGTASVPPGMGQRGRTRCGGASAATSSAASRSSASRRRPPAPPRRCPRAFHVTPPPASTTPPLRWPACCAAPRRTSSPTAIPGRLAGPIGDAALPSPDSLYIIIGRTAAQMARTPGTIEVTGFATALPGFGGARNPKGLNITPPQQGVGAGGVDLILSVVALALLTPLLIFIATATRLSAARREQRFAAMRLVGARPRQISLIATVESTVAAAAGVAVGLRPVLRAADPARGRPVHW